MKKKILLKLYICIKTIERFVCSFPKLYRKIITFDIKKYRIEKKHNLLRDNTKIIDTRTLNVDIHTVLSYIQLTQSPLSHIETIWSHKY